MSGAELAEKVSSLRPEANVLFTTGYTDDAVLQHGLLHEGVTILSKPCSPDGLKRMVRKVLGSADHEAATS